jgi:hypothetical protein
MTTPKDAKPSESLLQSWRLRALGGLSGRLGPANKRDLRKLCQVIPFGGDADPE